MAGDSAEETLLRQGVEARRRQDDTTALELFKQAYALHASGRALGQMGLAEYALGRWPDAESHLEEALAAHDDPWIVKNNKALQEALARVHREVGLLDVLGSPVGAEVVISGEVRGRLPLARPIRVRAGDVKFELRSPGFEPEKRAVNVPAGRITRETVVLMALLRPPPPPAPVVQTVLVAPTPEPALQVQQSVPEPASPSPSSGGRRLRTVGWVLGGLGVAAVGAGTVFGLKVRSASSNDSNAGLFVPDNESSGHRYETLQWIALGAGAALLAGGLVTHLLGGSR